ncbi:unnamed protein product [Sphagnum balticum]
MLGSPPAADVQTVGPILFLPLLLLLLQITFSPVRQQTTSLVPVHNHKQTEVHERRQGVSDCGCCLLDYPLLLLLLILVRSNNVLLLTPSPDCCCNCVPLGMHAS